MYKLIVSEYWVKMIQFVCLICPLCGVSGPLALPGLQVLVKEGQNLAAGCVELAHDGHHGNVATWAYFGL